MNSISSRVPLGSERFERKMERLHAVVLPTDSTGHINPMLGLSHRLVQLGFTVSFIVSEKTYAKMKKTRRKEDYIQLVPFSTEEDTRDLANYHKLLEPLVQLIKGLEQPVSCLISVMNWTQDLAKSLGIPSIAFWTASSFAEVICSNIDLLLSKGYVPVNENLNDESLITFLPGLPPLHRTQLPLAFYEGGQMLTVLAKAFQGTLEAFCILVNTVEELEEHVVSARRRSFNYFPVGPLVSPAFLKDDDNEGNAAGLSEDDLHCLRWLAKQAPSSVLYIAFGSAASLPAEQVEKIASGLEASKQPFLWAIRRNFALDMPESFYEGLQGRFGSQGLVVEWAPQLHVLRHSSVGGFFTHCGWNSTMEAICSGVPTLCWPCEAEQNLNASNMVENWKIGMKVTEGRNGDVQGEDIERLIRALMEGEEGKEVKSRIGGLKEIARGAFREGGSSEKNLRDFRNLILAAPKSE